MRIVKCISNNGFAGKAFLTVNRKYKVLDYNGTERIIIGEK